MNEPRPRPGWMLAVLFVQAAIAVAWLAVNAGRFLAGWDGFLAGWRAILLLVSGAG